MNYSGRSTVIVLLIFVISNASAFASAQVVAFNTFAADDSYAPVGDWQGSSSPYEVMLAQRFELSSAGRIELIELGMTFNPNSQGLNEVTLSIVPDVGGKPGDSALWQATYIGLLPIGHGHIAAFPIVNGPELNQNALYWLTTMAPPAGFRPQTWWSSSTTNSVNQRANKYLHGGGVFAENVWSIQYSGQSVDSRTLRITLVPEPSTLFLLGIGAISLLGYRKAKSHG